MSSRGGGENVPYLSPPTAQRLQRRSNQVVNQWNVTTLSETVMKNIHVFEENIISKFLDFFDWNLSLACIVWFLLNKTPLWDLPKTKFWLIGVHCERCKRNIFLQKPTGFFLNLLSSRYVVGFIRVELVGLFLRTITWKKNIFVLILFYLKLLSGLLSVFK